MLTQQNVTRRRELGQFFTPDPLADFMAALFEARWRDVRLLDAGAGVGALTSAVVRRLAALPARPSSIHVTAFEIDSVVVPNLQRALAECQRICDGAGIRFHADLHREDFIHAAVADSVGGLFDERRLPAFNAAIVNPPYRKLRSDSECRRLLSAAGIETSNLYTAFLALIVKLLEPGGELVSITPRSFCNGPYFKPFRRLLLREMSLRRLHVFESRSDAA